jgi:hypothetical protein
MNRTTTAETGQAQTDLRMTRAATPRTADRLDCETAALLRSVLLPLFEQSRSWNGLIDRLHSKGYLMEFRNGLLCLTDQRDGNRICGLRFLGLDLGDLTARLGRPFVLARPGNMADGLVLRQAPARASLH